MRRLAIEHGGHRADGLFCRCYLHVGNGSLPSAFPAGFFRQIFAQHRHGSEFQSLGNEAVTISLRTLDSHKEMPLLYLTRVDIDTRNLHIVWSDNGQGLYVLQQFS